MFKNYKGDKTALQSTDQFLMKVYDIQYNQIYSKIHYTVAMWHSIARHKTRSVVYC